MGGSFHFKNINTYVYEPEGESIITQPSQASMDFIPSDDCIQSDWEQTNTLRPDYIKNKPTIPENTSDLVNDSGFITTYNETDPVYTSEKNTLALKSDLTKESITGLKIDSSPEFADSNITSLSTESTYTPTVWSYLVGLFTTVPKSALQHLIKLWGVVNNLAVRIGLLEDNIIASYTFTEDVTTTFELTGFEILPNKPFRVIIKFPQVSNEDTAYIFYVRFNDISSSNYLTTNSLSSSFRCAAGQLYTYVEFNFTLSNGDLDGFAMGRTRRTDAIGSSFPMSNIFGCNIQSITSLSILLYTLPKIPAGSSITIYKV